MGSVEAEDTGFLEQDDLSKLMDWLDAIPLSKPKKNITRDFSDGVGVAEIIHYYAPRAVDLHNYTPASGTQAKKVNWITLNRKVLSKLNMQIEEDMINRIVETKPGAIEQFLWVLRMKLTEGSLPVFESSGSFYDNTATANSRTSMASASCDTVKMNVPPNSAVKGQSSAMRLGRRTSNFRLVPSTAIPTRVPMVVPKPAAAGVQFQGHINVCPRSPVLHTTLRAQARNRSRSMTPEPENKEFFESVKTLGNPEETPSKIIFQGQKMVSMELLEQKNDEMKEMENSKKQLELKVDRLLKLVEIKDNRIEDLAHQLANSRAMYESTTQDPFGHRNSNRSEAYPTRTDRNNNFQRGNY